MVKYKRDGTVYDVYPLTRSKKYRWQYRYIRPRHKRKIIFLFKAYIAKIGLLLLMAYLFVLMAQLL